MNKFLILSCLIVLGGIIGFQNVGDQTPNRIPSTSNISGSELLIGKTIDGIFSPTEWTSAIVSQEFYIDVDNSGDPPNVDGNNYMYLDEDYHFLYVALDLCSDQSPDPSSEWIGLWLNTNNSSFNNRAEWYNANNQGTESFIFDVGQDDIMPVFDEENTDNQDIYIDAYDINAINGIYSQNNGWGSSPRTNITSEWDGTNFISRLDLSINITENFEIVPQEFFQRMQSYIMNLYVFPNVSISTHQLVYWGNESEFNMENPNRIFPLNTQAGHTIMDQSEILSNNWTENGMLRFSFIANNSEPFSIEFGSFYSYAITDAVSKGWILNYCPITTLETAKFSYGFGSSPNNASNHRIFEFAIPKSNLEGYSSLSDLGVIVGGYGTMSFEGTNYWKYDKDLETNGVPYFVESAYYHNYTMPLKTGLSAPGDFILAANAENPDLDGQINLTWTPAIGADNYSILIGEGDAFELSSILVLDRHTSTSPSTIMLENGTYICAIAAYNESGASISNIIQITVAIPPEDPTDTSSETSSGTSEPQPTPSTVDGYPIALLLISCGIPIFILIKFKKSQRNLDQS